MHATSNINNNNNNKEKCVHNVWRMVIVYQIFIQFMMKYKRYNLVLNPHAEHIPRSYKNICQINGNFVGERCWIVCQANSKRIPYIILHIGKCELRNKNTSIQYDVRPKDTIRWHHQSKPSTTIHMEKYLVFNRFKVQTNIYICECVCLIWCKNLSKLVLERGWFDFDLTCSLSLSLVPFMPFSIRLHLFQVLWMKDLCEREMVYWCRIKWCVQ